MPESKLQPTRTEVNGKVSIYIKGLSTQDLIDSRLCDRCLPYLPYPCCGYTNGCPCFTVPANEMSSNTLNKLNSKRLCRDI